MKHALRRAGLGLLLALTAACGVDGPPTRPDPDEVPAPGVQVSGDARFGVVTRL